MASNMQQIYNTQALRRFTHALRKLRKITHVLRKSFTQQLRRHYAEITQIHYAKIKKYTEVTQIIYAIITQTLCNVNAKLRKNVYAQYATITQMCLRRH